MVSVQMDKTSVKLKTTVKFPPSLVINTKVPGDRTIFIFRGGSLQIWIEVHSECGKLVFEKKVKSRFLY